MTRPTDASTARAFRLVVETESDKLSDMDARTFVSYVLGKAERFDAESPAGTDVEQVDPILRRLEEKHPAPIKRTCTVSTCRAEMRPGLHCGGAQCPLRNPK